MPTIVAKDQLDRLFSETAAENADSVSPRAPDGECLYLSADGRYCLVAKALIEKLGFEYNPNWEGREPTRLLQDLGFDKDAASVAYKWQDDPEKPPVRWGTLGNGGSTPRCS